MKNLLSYIYNEDKYNYNNSFYLLGDNKSFKNHHKFEWMNKNGEKFLRKNNYNTHYCGGYLNDLTKIKYPNWKDVSKNNKQWEDKKNMRLVFERWISKYQKPNQYYFEIFHKKNRRYISWMSNHHHRDHDIELTAEYYCSVCGTNEFIIPIHDKIIFECSNCGSEFKNKISFLKETDNILKVKRSYKLKELGE
jgi:ribosomal protein L37AE/L43A